MQTPNIPTAPNTEYLSNMDKVKLVWYVLLSGITLVYETNLLTLLLWTFYMAQNEQPIINKLLGANLNFPFQKQPWLVLLPLVMVHQHVFLTLILFLLYLSQCELEGMMRLWEGSIEWLTRRYRYCVGTEAVEHSSGTEVLYSEAQQVDPAPDHASAASAPISAFGAVSEHRNTSERTSLPTRKETTQHRCATNPDAGLAATNGPNSSLDVPVAADERRELPSDTCFPPELAGIGLDLVRCARAVQEDEPKVHLGKLTGSAKSSKIEKASVIEQVGMSPRYPCKVLFAELGDEQRTMILALSGPGSSPEGLTALLSDFASVKPDTDEHSGFGTNFPLGYVTELISKGHRVVIVGIGLGGVSAELVTRKLFTSSHYSNVLNDSGACIHCLKLLSPRLHKVTKPLGASSNDGFSIVDVCLPTLSSTALPYTLLYYGSQSDEAVQATVAKQVAKVLTPQVRSFDSFSSFNPANDEIEVGTGDVGSQSHASSSSSSSHSSSYHSSSTSSTGSSNSLSFADKILNVKHDDNSNVPVEPLDVEDDDTAKRLRRMEGKQTESLGGKSSNEASERDAIVRYNDAETPLSAEHAISLVISALPAVCFHHLFQGLPGQTTLESKLRTCFPAATLNRPVRFSDIVTVPFRSLLSSEPNAIPCLIANEFIHAEASSEMHEGANRLVWLPQQKLPKTFAPPHELVDYIFFPSTYSAFPVLRNLTSWIAPSWTQPVEAAIQPSVRVAPPELTHMGISFIVDASKVKVKMAGKHLSHIDSLILKAGSSEVSRISGLNLRDRSDTYLLQNMEVGSSHLDPDAVRFLSVHVKTIWDHEHFIPQCEKTKRQTQHEIGDHIANCSVSEVMEQAILLCTSAGNVGSETREAFEKLLSNIPIEVALGVCADPNLSESKKELMGLKKDIPNLNDNCSFPLSTSGVEVLLENGLATARKDSDETLADLCLFWIGHACRDRNWVGEVLGTFLSTPFLGAAYYVGASYGAGSVATVAAIGTLGSVGAVPLLALGGALAWSLPKTASAKYRARHKNPTTLEQKCGVAKALIDKFNAHILEAWDSMCGETITLCQNPPLQPIWSPSSIVGGCRLQPARDDDNDDNGSDNATSKTTLKNLEKSKKRLQLFTNMVERFLLESTASQKAGHPEGEVVMSELPNRSLKSYLAILDFLVSRIKFSHSERWTASGSERATLMKKENVVCEFFNKIEASEAARTPGLKLNLVKLAQQPEKWREKLGSGFGAIAPASRILVAMWVNLIYCLRELRYSLGTLSIVGILGESNVGKTKLMRELIADGDKTKCKELGLPSPGCGLSCRTLVPSLYQHWLDKDILVLDMFGGDDAVLGESLGAFNQYHISLMKLCRVGIVLLDCTPNRANTETANELSRLGKNLPGENPLLTCFNQADKLIQDTDGNITVGGLARLLEQEEAQRKNCSGRGDSMPLVEYTPPEETHRPRWWTCFKDNDFLAQKLSPDAKYGSPIPDRTIRSSRHVKDWVFQHLLSLA